MPSKLAAVYDWDSVSIAPEPYFVGKASVHGTSVEAEAFVVDSP